MRRALESALGHRRDTAKEPRERAPAARDGGVRVRESSGVGVHFPIRRWQIPAVAGAPEDQKAVAMAGIIQGAMGPALLGTVGGMALTAAAAWLARKAGGPGGGPRP